MKFTTNVIKGHGRGEKVLGYPTLNLTIPPNLKSPHGIYAGWLYLDSQKFPGAFHFGPIPVFQNPEPSLEVFVIAHRFTYRPDQLSFELVQRIRDILNFPTPQELSHQISLDIKQTKHILS